MIYGGEHNSENIHITKCDNGFIVNVFIPITYRDPNIEMVDRMADRILKSKEGEEWKEQFPEPIPIPDQKSSYTYVCKDEKEVLERLTEFFKMTK